MERLWSKARRDSSTGCLIWTACIVKRYGQLWWNGKAWRAHRAAWTVVGPIPSGLLVCHHCDQPLCIEPSHLFLGTAKDNTQDAVAKGRTRNQNARKTHCPHGHEYTTQNTWRGRAGKRMCRVCIAEKSRRRRAALVRGVA